jgi:hypothetical protein
MGGYTSVLKAIYFSAGIADAVATVRLCAAGLRSFLRFCFLQGVIAVDLATAVPPVGHWQRKPCRRC